MSVRVRALTLVGMLVIATIVTIALLVHYAH
jgi:competence protein ComGC